MIKKLTISKHNFVLHCRAVLLILLFFYLPNVSHSQKFDNDNSIQSACIWLKLSNVPAIDEISKIVQFPDGKVFAATKKFGVYLSNNNGQNWMNYNDNLTNSRVYDLVYNSNGYLFAATDSGVFRRQVGQTLWQWYGRGLTNLKVRAIATKQFDGLSCGTENGFFVWDNNANQWVDSSTNLVNRNITCLAVTGNNYVLAGTKGNGMQRKVDPAPWFSINTGITNPNINAVITYQTTFALAASDSGLFYTSTSGSSWFRRNNIPLVKYISLAYNKINNWVAIGTTTGSVYISTNYGNNWQLVSAGLPNKPITALCFLENGSLLAGTNAGEVYQLAPCEVPLSYVDVLNPKPGDVYFANNNVSISWLSSGVTNVDIDFSLDSGLTYTNIATNLNTNLGTYNWIVPSNVITNKAFIRVKSTNSSISGHSGVFTIIDSNLITLNITQPVGGEVFLSQKNIIVKWTSSYSQTLDILFSNDNGASWQTIESNVPSELGEYAITLPSVNSKNCRIRIVDGIFKSKFSTTPNFEVLDKQQFSLNILTPYSGEQWQINSQQTITWQSTGLSTIHILLSTDGGQNWTILASNVDASAQKYTLTVPPTPSQSCKIKLVSTQFPNDFSSQTFGLFTIVGLHLLLPNSGSYMADVLLPITWESIGTSTIRISYTINNGLDWIVIVDNYPALSGVYSWRVPKTPSNQCKIRIMDTKQSSIFDESDSLFAIKGLQLISPKGGETLYVGQKFKIKWDHLETNLITIKFSTNGGAAWQTVASNVPANAKEYEWTVPNLPTRNAVIGIFDMSNSSFFDRNSNPFSIVGNGIVLLSPNGGEIFDANNLATITWSSINSLKLNIMLSLDGGKTWQTIADSVNSNSFQYEWFVVDTTTTEAMIKLVDTYNPTVGDVSDGLFKIRKANTPFPPPSDWFVISQTGDNALIIIPDTINPKVGTRKLQTGDYVSVWFNRNGELVCGGLSKWVTYKNMSITVWGDNPYTEEKDGFAPNENYIYKIWDGQKGVAYFASARYSSYTGSSGNTFAPNKISYVSSLSSSNNLNITLNRNIVNLISSNVVPDMPAIEGIFASVTATNFLRYVQDQWGQTYFPSHNINQIGNWNVRTGYQVVTNNNYVSQSFTITGEIIEPEQYPLDFVARQWYIIPFLPMYAMRTTDAFNSISSSILLVKDENGNSYIPGTNTDNIKVLYPGKGYKLITRQDVKFIYPNINFYYGSIANTDFAFNEPEVLKPKHTQTGFSSNVSVELIDYQEMEGELGVLNEKGEIVGSAIIGKPLTPITIWGDNPFTDDVIEGATNNEELKLVLYDKRKNIQIPLEVRRVVNIISGNEVDKFFYLNDGFFFVQAKAVEPSVVKSNEIDLLEIYPNPTNSLVHIFLPYDLTNSSINIIDEFGRKAKEFNSVNIGLNTFDISELKSGVYFVIINDGVVTKQAKLVKIN